MPDTTSPIAAPSALDDLKFLRQIMERVEKLSPPAKTWLRDRLTADLAEAKAKEEEF